MKRLAILGATGSIGQQTLEVCRQHPDRLKIVAMTANRDAEKLQEFAAEFGVKHLALNDKDAAKKAGLPGGIGALTELATRDDIDWVVVSVAGVVGLIPTLAAIRAKKHIALASKEVLVAAGEVVMPLIAESGVQMTPIDSEHSAIFQCMQGYTPDQVGSITLTASGGPFRGRARAELEGISVEQALNHPTWRMGGKITIDSATLFNKALEMIEARWLFGLEMEQVNVVVHPQSVVHSLVTFKDGSVLGQLGWPDMKLPIQYALLWPERKENQLPAWDPIKTSPLTFEAVDEAVFTSLGLAREAARIGGTMPCVFNAANEEAVALFLDRKLRFLQIFDAVEKAMLSHRAQSVTIEALLESDAWARNHVRNLLVG